MNYLKTIAGSGLTLILAFSAPIAWAQSAPDVTVSGAAGAYNASWSAHDSAAAMDQNVAREIKQAWSEGKDATGAMAFQENGEIAIDEGKDQQARQYFQRAQQELATLTPGHTNDNDRPLF